MQTNSGFSLIEILVVLVIIGVTLSFALLTMGDFGQKRQLIVSAEEFMNYVTFIEQQAVLEMHTYRIQFEKNNYHVSRYKTANTWENMPELSIFHTRRFNDNTIPRLYAGSNKSQENSIIINATGQITPFTLHLDTKKQEDVVIIHGYANGQLTHATE